VNASSSPASTQKTAASSGLNGTGISTPAIASVRSKSLVRYVQTALCLTTKRVAATLLSHVSLPRRNAGPTDYTDPTTPLMRRPALAIARSQRPFLELPHPAKTNCFGIHTLADAKIASILQTIV
jgi:hypothetical protein